MKNENKYLKIAEKVCLVKKPGKKTLQKLMYLMERKGVKLDLNYSMHHFGPYSAKLDDAIHLLNVKGLMDIDTSVKPHVINVLADNAADYGFEDEEEEKVDYVIGKFVNKTDLELEAITTLDYVNEVIIKKKGSENDIVDETIRIKGSRFPKNQLEGELVMLKECGLLV